VNIHSCGNDHLWFRSYSGSLGKAPSNQGLLPLTFGASLWLGMPSLRSCSVGPPPSAIHGRGRLSRHPCRVAHCAEPPLGLTRGRTPQQRPRRPTGRPVGWVRSTVMYLVDCQVAIASKLAPTGIEYICKISVGCQAAFAGKPAPTGVGDICKNQVGCQAAIANRLAPTEEQRQIGVHKRSSPLIRPSVSSPAALDLDPPAPSGG
jgi:hypothetical protein